MPNKKILGWEVYKLKAWFLYWTAVGISTFLLIFLLTSTWIGVDVRQQCQVAQGRYDGDCTAALITTLDDEQNTLRQRNNAVWALGQLGDRRALPAIKKYYTGIIPDREPYNKVLSQYEMKKAIKLIESGFNATAFIWRDWQFYIF